MNLQERKERNPRPLFIIDTGVILHQIIDFTRDDYGELENQLTPAQLYSKIEHGVNLYNSLFFIQGIDTSRCDILWVGDSTNGYWRNGWFKNWLDERPDFVENLRKEYTLEPLSGDWLPTKEGGRRKHPLVLGYKGNRKPCPYKQMAKKMINKISKAVVIDNYEADDVATAALFAFPRRRIFLCTIDTDWLQLVDERVTWLCMKGYKPQYRDPVGGMEWFKAAISKGTKAGQERFADIDSLRDIVPWKMFSGDKSDNLPKGSPREVIDLLNPPSEYQLWTQRENIDEIRAAIIRGKSPFSSLKAQDRAYDAGFTPTTQPILRDWSVL
jgi:hypothetical protein